MTIEEKRKYQREWMRKRREDPKYRKLGSEKTRAWQLDNPEKTTFNQYRVNARKRNYTFELSFSDLSSLILAPCTYCGIEPAPVNGIDRIDNSVGYVRGNCTPCCKFCNIAKHTQSTEDFKNWITRTYKHLNR